MKDLRKVSLRHREEESWRGTRLKLEPGLYWMMTLSIILHNCRKGKTNNTKCVERMLSIRICIVNKSPGMRTGQSL